MSSAIVTVFKGKPGVKQMLKDAEKYVIRNSKEKVENVLSP